MRIRLSAEGKLSVVVPAGFRVDQVIPLLERKKAWISRHLEKIGPGTPTPPPDGGALPDLIDLKAFAEEWKVVYERGWGAKSKVVEDGASGRLVVPGSVPPHTAKCLLRHWLLGRSRLMIEPRLREMSAKGRMPFDKLTMRLQKTRWGSCSRSGHISLNAKMAFLPLQLVDYVLWHELCHTRWMDHSPSFWGLLERNYGGSQEARRELRLAERLVPAWVEKDLRGPGEKKTVLTIKLQGIN